jgi:hypothetical protein
MRPRLSLPRTALPCRSPLSTQLEGLELCLSGECHLLDLLPAVGRQVQPATALLTVSYAVSLALLSQVPQLQELSISLGTDVAVAQLESAITALTCLQRLTLYDERPAMGQRPSPPLRCAGLERLPRLARLECSRSLPASAWLCPHLTRLTCTGAIISPPASRIAVTGLRQLVFTDQCTFPEADTYPAVRAGLPDRPCGGFLRAGIPA